jgi:uncharacterized damage-inducible protein DinB
MPQIVQSILVPYPGCRSAEVALLLAQLHDLHTRLLDATRELGVAALGWQPAPGVNTIGMLLAHIAVAETHITQVGVLGEKDGHEQDVIGIGGDDDGMPLAADAAPPAVLHGRDVAFFHAVLDRSLVYATRAAIDLTDADLDRRVERTRPDGAQRVLNVRWVLHHVVEHLAAHYGQVLLLRHLHEKAKT